MQVFFPHKTGNMESTVLTLFLVIPLSIFLLIYATAGRRRRPPYPVPPLPIIGHLHLLRLPLHRTLHRLSQKHGPIFSLKLGSRLVAVVSSLPLAEECFTTNDAVFNNRTYNLASKYIGYNQSTMVGLPHCDRWRRLRRLAAEEVFSAARLNSSLPIRLDEIEQLLKSLLRPDPENGFHRVELRPKFSQLTFNLMVRMIAGKRFFAGDMENRESVGVRELIKEVLEVGDVSNPEDFFPLLRWLDWRGVKKRLAALGERLDDFVQKLIDDCRREETPAESTMIGHLLSLQQSEPHFYTDLAIKGLINNMIIAGTETSSMSMEWGMAALLNHPKVMRKAREELDRVVGFERLVNESDLPQLHYLQCIVSETLRLFPPAPLLLPHYSSEACKVGGYDIPSGTMLLVNAFAIHRDPNLWNDDPTSFVPERFEGWEVESSSSLVASQRLIVMPFGMGRRSCPGAGLAKRIIALVLASMIQCFEWKRITERAIDLDEGKGLTMPKAKPLVAMCKARKDIHKVLHLP
ncbi:unnamed protein product [Cuscuta campestris]|uniref:Cytochrome P450 n=1 Tax=Cuscuta campestris TaxID=132261 RepID=A0A484K986_9ASTE|nr:unnamed protein product [Cuscuta campestris]